MTAKMPSASRAPFAADRAAAMAAECDSWGDLVSRAYLLWRRDEAPMGGGAVPPASRAAFLERMRRFEAFLAAEARGPVAETGVPISGDSSGTESAE